MDWLKKLWKSPRSRQSLLEEKYKKLFLKSKKEIPPFMLIQRDQLESLLEHPIYFVLIHVGEVLGGRPFHNKAQFVLKSEIFSFIKSSNIESHTPIVFVCDDGSKSLEAAQNFSKKGFCNIVVLDQGLKNQGFI